MSVAHDCRRWSVRSERGFATLWVVTAMTLVGAATAVALWYGAAVVERHRAATAADAVVLDVALKSIQGPVAACRDGGVLGRQNGARLVRCELLGSIADVSVTVRLPGLLARFGAATARARAGPVGTTGAARGG